MCYVCELISLIKKFINNVNKRNQKTAFNTHSSFQIRHQARQKQPHPLSVPSGRHPKLQNIPRNRDLPLLWLREDRRPDTMDTGQGRVQQARSYFKSPKLDTGAS